MNVSKTLTEYLEFDPSAIPSTMEIQHLIQYLMSLSLFLSLDGAITSKRACNNDRRSNAATPSLGQLFFALDEIKDRMHHTILKGTESRSSFARNNECILLNVWRDGSSSDSDKDRSPSGVLIWPPFEAQ
jgi:hypothetical protein